MQSTEEKRAYDREYRIRRRAQRAAYNRQWKTEHPEQVQAQRRRNYERNGPKRRIVSAAKIQATREFVAALKRGPCVDCGGQFHWVAMDFDHVRGAKFKDVADLVSAGYDADVIMTEIAKCDLVCANCHRVRIFNRNHNNERG